MNKPALRTLAPLFLVCLLSSPVQAEGAVFSNKPDAAGNPRLVGGFAGARFEEDDGSVGTFFGSFVGVSEDLRNR